MRLEKWQDELPLVGVLTLIGLGIVLVLVHRWRAGLVLFGIGLLMGGTLRAVLPESRAGSLAVRSRFFDVLALGLSGGTLIVLAESLTTTF